MYHLLSDTWCGVDEIVHSYCIELCTFDVKQDMLIDAVQYQIFFSIVSSLERWLGVFTVKMCLYELVLERMLNV